MVPRSQGLFRRRPARALPRALGAGTVLALVLATAGPAARGEPAKPAPSAAADEPAKPAPAAEAGAGPAAIPPAAEARARFEKGLGLFKQAVWAPALAEFLASRKLFPTKNATYNAAVCLRELQRFDEALDMFEALLTSFADVPADLRAEAQRAIVELRALVGTVEIDGAQIGATIAIDNTTRADFPAPAPLRVAAGAHIVRVYKEGFEPFEKRLDIAGGQTVRVTARLRAATESGRLRVLERGGGAAAVILDGVAVGTTPWEGVVPVGKHLVLLRGEQDVGTQPATASVSSGQTATLTLQAEPLAAALVVETTPAGALIVVDSVEVGRGLWEGRLRAGNHRLEVAAEGFVSVKRDLALERDGREVVKVALDRDPESPLWKKPSKVVLDATAALVITPTFGGRVSAGCSGACSASPGLGGLVFATLTYQLGSGFGFGIGSGYFAVEQGLRGRSTSLTPVGLPNARGTVDDTLRLSGVPIAAFASYRFGERWPVLLRLGIGSVFGRLGDARSGSFVQSDDSTHVAPTLVDERPAQFLAITTEAQLGFRVTSHLDLGAALRAMVLFTPSMPVWGQNKPRPVLLPVDGYSTYPAETITNNLIFLVAPGVTARYSF